ncbi:unnamed protein product [Didymodactylos carnosus]|uniref:Uncharacterized protein n=1 Tax=Didymodactylos carnosus TaxID=1234261 RepID=A0A814FGX3_9BILA|nr:unnamed protein product [Didymodactylos carnosus]CAF1089289.1 unnamed protein product [Didymodactylos carnosus]CAF3753043.1 unnamed protein product [Didymodactylos carnosus]CAF3850998.1 unnamed protein product [Didymodactylos carnosus]
MDKISHQSACITEKSQKQQWEEKGNKRRTELERKQQMQILNLLNNIQWQDRVSQQHEIIELTYRHDAYTRNDINALLKLLRRLLYEFVGTFLLVLGHASLRIQMNLKRMSAIELAIANGLIIVSLIYSLRSLSGAHFNPVVTLIFSLRRTFPFIWLPFYYVVQFLASLSAGGLMPVLLKENVYYGSQINSSPTNPFRTLGQALINSSQHGNTSLI